MSIDPDLLREEALFASLGAAGRKAVAASANLRHLGAGVCAFAQGEPIDEIFLLLSGCLKLARISWGREAVILRIVHPGELFDLGHGPPPHRHDATASALRDSTLAVWPAASWQRLLREVPGLPLGLVQQLGLELAETQGRFLEIASLDVPRRLAHAVLRLIERAGRQEAGGMRIDFPLSQQDLAALTGTTLHNVSRILTRWERGGLITGGRRTLLVRDIPALTRLATAEA
ncbi:Crp/Fnr family transcriptional regulator [Bosea sp. (in: a-proteobacteria)]|uniref:Crp/Fnr family transcriptional regulator n=1 Tax=Bosea sp. (in: a-proteobacteria) TaxID=1871050 RepID=UPI002638A36C|nr:Crp/Fnr family transcriptional regulator [Bosea sp. (in: a-proteobacteria)]MCO5089994.1 Crp/Fnr family transcriptional regulator [Bosea sp. (in: a-proteobacteria)]